MTKAATWVVIALVLTTGGAWAQFGNLLKAPSLDTREFDELNAKIDSVKLKYDQGTAQIFQSAEILYQFVDKHHQLPSLSKTWPEIVKALNEAKSKEQQKLAQEGFTKYLNDLQARKTKCDTLWQDISTLSTLKRLLSAEELKLQNARAEADTGIAKDREALESAQSLIAQTSDAVTSLSDQLQKNPLAAVKIKSVLSKIQSGKEKISEIVRKAPDQIEVGVDLVQKIIALFAAP